MKDYELRERLTVSVEDFDDIILGRKLGANSNIQSIIHMLEDLAGQVRSGKLSGVEGWTAAMELTAYFDRMRGDSTVAVRNAIRQLMDPVRDMMADPDGNPAVNQAAEWAVDHEADRAAGGGSADGKATGLKIDGKSFADRLFKSCEDYQYESAHWNEKVLACAREVLKEAKTVMVYDYSSSVDAILKDMETWEQEMRIYVPESRTLDGGIPFVRNHVRSKLKFSLIPDCAMAFYIGTCDAALVGVETFCGDGGLYNTTGSLTLAVLCREYGIPFYGVTQFIKLSRELSEKHPKELEEYDMSEVLGVSEGVTGAQLDVRCVGIELVPPRYLTGYITEKGFLLPGEIMKNI